MNQTPYNLLHELETLLYSIAQAENKALALPQKEQDPITARDITAKGRLLLLGARIIRDIRETGGENFEKLLEKGAEKGITLYNCDVEENKARIMPPP